MTNQKNKSDKIKQTFNKQSLQKRWNNYREERELAKKGKTKKSRLNEMERYRKVEHRLNLAIIAVTLALVIVLLFTFFI